MFLTIHLSLHQQEGKEGVKGNKPKKGGCCGSRQPPLSTASNTEHKGKEGSGPGVGLPVLLHEQKYYMPLELESLGADVTARDIFFTKFCVHAVFLARSLMCVVSCVAAFAIIPVTGGEKDGPTSLTLQEFLESEAFKCNPNMKVCVCMCMCLYTAKKKNTKRKELILYTKEKKEY